MRAASCLGILLAALVAPAKAQTPSSSPAPGATPPTGATAARVTISGWSVECGTRGSALSCYALDRMTQTSTGALLSTISISIPTDTKQATLVLQLPLGIAVSAPVKVSVGDAPEQQFSVLTCNRSGCFVRGALQPELLAAMRTPTQPLRIVYAALDAGFAPQAVTMVLGLDGFSAAYAKIK